MLRVCRQNCSDLVPMRFRPLRSSPCSAISPAKAASSEVRAASAAASCASVRVSEIMFWLIYSCGVSNDNFVTGPWVAVFAVDIAGGAADLPETYVCAGGSNGAVVYGG